MHTQKPQPYSKRIRTEHGYSGQPAFVFGRHLEIARGRWQHKRNDRYAHCRIEVDQTADGQQQIVELAEARTDQRVLVLHARVVHEIQSCSSGIAITTLHTARIHNVCKIARGRSLLRTIAYSK